MPTPDKTPSVPTPDPLIDEIRAIRSKISAEFGDDVNQLVEHLREVEQQHASRVLQPDDIRRSAKAKAS